MAQRELILMKYQRRKEIITMLGNTEYEAEVDFTEQHNTFLIIACEYN